MARWSFRADEEREATICSPSATLRTRLFIINRNGEGGTSESDEDGAAWLT